MPEQWGDYANLMDKYNRAQSVWTKMKKSIAPPKKAKTTYQVQATGLGFSIHAHTTDPSGDWWKSKYQSYGYWSDKAEAEAVMLQWKATNKPDERLNTVQPVDYADPVVDFEEDPDGDMEDAEPDNWMDDDDDED